MAQTKVPVRRRSRARRLDRLASFVVLAFVNLWFMTSAAQADECGNLTCTDITSNQAIEIFTGKLREMKTDCQSVKEVRLFDKSDHGVMMIYAIKCHDGVGVQDYQLFHWGLAREFIVDKLSGSWMKPITLKY